MSVLGSIGEMFSGVKHLLVAGIVGLALGLAAGIYLDHKLHVAAEAKELEAQLQAEKKARADDARQVEVSQAKSVLIATEVATINSSVDRIKKEIKRYAPRKPTAVAGKPADPAGPSSDVGMQSCARGPGDLFLTRGELWLLDLAREGRNLDLAPGFNDGEGTAPSDVTRDEFLENDLEVVKRFNRLKKKHDELVDYVLELQRKQRERLGASEQ